ncbi:hypothetical protein [Bradyrhizobium liaoningense]|uniref:hypothetical protein n=1 Tax=Bradyrhizobium liaoningense TaxID=43992 RepID=UPI001FE9E59F|nr:hypothetical protein [Bradyrhizobium liaoningense]
MLGYIGKVVADDLRLGSNSEDVVSGPPDERGFPTGRHGAERIPGVAGDHAELRRTGSQFILDVNVGLRRGLINLDAVTLNDLSKNFPIPAPSSWRL